MVVFSMNSVLLQSKFNFNHFRFSKFKYTDSRSGAAYNYLAYMIKGNAKIITRKENIIINEGDIFFIPKNLSYQSYWYGNDEIEFISLGFIEIDSKEYAEIKLQSVPATEEIADSMINVPTNGKEISCDILYKFYYAFSLSLKTLEKSHIKTKITLVEKIKDSIKDNPFCSLSEVSLQCNISEPYMYALFRKNQSYSPNDYRQKVLCEMAIDMLITTDKSVEEICSDLKFSSSSYFRKILKKHIGLTPREIRRQNIF